MVQLVRLLFILYSKLRHLEPDPTRPGKGLSMQLRISLNIPLKDIQSDDVARDEMLTLLRFFNEGNQSDL